jgi:1-acyl-sn-glycerol-3-phosphate acyltransferase
MNRVVPELPASTPRTGGNAFSRWLGRTVLRLGGWKVVGEWPDLPKLMVIAAPHSSAWDAFWGIAAKVAMGIRIDFMAKAELFTGPLGWALRFFGGIPVNRSAARGVVEQVAAQFRSAEKMWFVLAPEGTRRTVTQWKTGFWKIARAAEVPVFCVWFHYPDKTIGLGPLVELTADVDADLRRIRALFRPHIGKNRGVMDERL